MQEREDRNVASAIGYAFHKGLECLSYVKYPTLDFQATYDTLPSNSIVSTQVPRLPDPPLILCRSVQDPLPQKQSPVITGSTLPQKLAANSLYISPRPTSFRVLGLPAQVLMKRLNPDQLLHVPPLHRRSSGAFGRGNAPTISAQVKKSDKPRLRSSL
jgi:hypothetical protein